MSKKTNCNACNKNIVTLLYMECSKCNELYDLECLSIPTESFQGYTDQHKATWVCPTCICSKPKVGDTSTPIRLLNNTFTSDTINNIRGSRGKQRSLQTKETEEPTIAEVMNELRLLRQDIMDVKSQLTTVSTTLSQKIEEYDRKLEAKDIEIRCLQSSINDLQIRINDQEQHNVRSEMEIMGVPEQSNENLAHMLHVISNKIGVSVHGLELDEIRRVGPKRTQSITSTEEQTSRPIVVKFLHKSKRDEFLTAAKARRNLSAGDIVEGSKAKIYFNERLSNLNRQLFREAKIRSRLHNFEFCWVRNGTIYIRKAGSSNGKRLPALPIRSHNDIDMRIGPAAVAPPTASVS